MSWLKGLTDSLGLTSTGPSAATLEQIKTAPVGTQSLGEQRVSSFDEDLQKAFKPLVRGWQPGQAPLTQEQYDRIQSASLDLFDKLGYTNPMGSQPSRMVAASMRKAVRPPPKSYAEAKTPTATEVSFQHASPHKFTNVDEANPFGQFSEAHLLKGEGATVYGPGAAYVSTAEPTHQHYLNAFRGKNITRDSFAPIEQRFGALPKYLEKELVNRPWTHPSKLDESLARQEAQIDRSLQQYKMLAADPQNTAQQKAAWQERITAKEQELKDLQTADNWLQPIIKTGKSFENLGLDTRAFSYRGSLAEDPARTVLFDKPLTEQTPEVQAALARASSRARKDVTPEITSSGSQNFIDTQSGLRGIDSPVYRSARAEIERAIVTARPAPSLDKVESELKAQYLRNNPEGNWEKESRFTKDFLYNQLVRENPKLIQAAEKEERLRMNLTDFALRNPTWAKKNLPLSDYANNLVNSIKYQPRRGVAPSTQTAGEYIAEAKTPKDYRSRPKTVQRFRDAGIDLIKYSGSSASPNYVVVNPAASKIQSRTPSIAATFGTGELARQLYESIYGKEAP